MGKAYCYPDRVPFQLQDAATWKPVPLPGAVTLTGEWVTLEPLSSARHAHDLWLATEHHDAVWMWLADGPYVHEADLSNAIATKETGAAARFFAMVPKAGPHLETSAEAGDRSIRAKGYASLMRIDPANGVIEVGNILFSPALQRTPAATETLYLLARFIFEELGYRRLEWKCNALNLPSRRAAERYGFSFEGIFRQHMIVKGQSRDTAWFSMLDWEWPGRKEALEAWLAPGNFDERGQQKKPLAR